MVDSWPTRCAGGCSSISSLGVALLGTIRGGESWSSQSCWSRAAVGVCSQRGSPPRAGGLQAICIGSSVGAHVRLSCFRIGTRGTRPIRASRIPKQDPSSLSQGTCRFTKIPRKASPGLFALAAISRGVSYGATTMIWFGVSAPEVIVRPPASRAALKPDAAGGVARST